MPLTSPYDTWLTDANNAGYYKVTLTVDVQCSGVDDEYVGYFYLNAPPSPANMLLTINNGSNGTTCATKNHQSQCITGNFSAAFSLGISGSTFSTNNITYYKRKIEKIDCFTGTIASGPPLYEDANPVTPANPNNPIVALSLNGLTIGGSTGYFTNRFDECFKLTVEVGNACSSSSDWTYFQITDVNNQFRFKSIQLNEAASDLTVFPNPITDGLLNIQLNSENSDLARLRILDYTGMLIQESSFTVNGDFELSEKQLDISTFSKGIYYLEYLTKGERKIKKFVVQ